MKNPLDWNIEELMQVNTESIDEHNKKEIDINEKIYLVFSSKEGKHILDWLVENTIHSATWMASLPYEKAIAHGFAREGQNALVRDLLNRIENHKQRTNHND